MTSTIVILDDEIDRLEAMTAVLSKRLPGYEMVTFKNAPDIVAWLASNISSAAIISLDHDLFPQSEDDPDPGTGRDVADFLATQSPVCHVIIHTTNSLAAPGMELALNDRGWTSSRVMPFNDLEWVTVWWVREVLDHL
ncbi:cyclic-phosphate processing receiver domain-containing protein [uncultured Gimesia sp.]|uniref:cyclic-phosphate processing receiver domain-containing protein n=1 Tax=uncultured Gimesia sp. TaxID=1678688 RepID=UPI0030D8DBCC|tara:strand:+ start:39231 stop:39644 length:414 start_codon:yes stop_codon:yes gene_type:complete